MTLQEFVNLGTNRYYLVERFEKLKQHVAMMKITTGTQFLSHSSDVDRYYEYINGYLMAAEAYGHISGEKRNDLVNELIRATDYRDE